MSAYRWKSFYEDEDRPEKPRRYGVTEMRSPNYTVLNQNVLEVAVMHYHGKVVAITHYLQKNEGNSCYSLDFSFEPLAYNSDQICLRDILESMGQFVDGLKFSGGSYSLMPKQFVQEITDMAHRHNVYVSTGDWAEHLLHKGPSAFKQYLEECKNLGFDTIELNVGSLKVPEDTLLRFVRMIKSGGLRVKPQFAVKFEKSEIPSNVDRAFGAYVAPVPKTSEIVEDVDFLIRRAERCLEAGADMIMIDADDICNDADSLRADIVAKIIGRLGLERAMFEVSTPKTSEWFIKRYGPRVNLFVDHSQVMDLECLRGRSLGKNHTSVLGPSYFLF